MNTLYFMSIWNWLLIIILLMTVANGIIAHRKRRSVAGWVILGLMFNPIAFVALLWLPTLHAPLTSPAAGES